VGLLLKDHELDDFLHFPWRSGFLPATDFFLGGSSCITRSSLAGLFFPFLVFGTFGVWSIGLAPTVFSGQAEGNAAFDPRLDFSPAEASSFRVSASAEIAIR